MENLFTRNEDGTLEIKRFDIESKSKIISIYDLYLIATGKAELNEKYKSFVVPDFYEEEEKDKPLNNEIMDKILRGGNLKHISIVEKDNRYYLACGLQLLKAVCHVFNDEEIIIGDEMLKFSELSENSQKIIKQRPISLEIQNGKDADLERTYKKFHEEYK